MNFKALPLLFAVTFVCVNGEPFLDKRDAFYWISEARNAVKNKVQHLKETFGDSHLLNRKAKNLIFFLGDGMGLSTITAARIYKGNKDGKSDPADGYLEFEKFPFSSLVKVNSFDKLVGDSASTSTAYLRGVKANWRTLGVSPRVKLNDCEASLIPKNRLTSIFDWAQEKGLFIMKYQLVSNENNTGKLTGFVTTTRITHASPAGLYAHSAQRDWEGDTQDKKCQDIAAQLIHGDTGKKIRVMLGGGKREFFPTNCGFHCESGARKDGRNLVDEWLKDKKSHQLKAKYVTTDKELAAISSKDTDYLLGLFSYSHLTYNLDRNSSTKEPTLTQMVIKAIELLSKNKDGYFLFVEGGRIDHGHHENRAKLALDETYEFNKAIQTAMSIINHDETLVVVTADHSHSLTINGYQSRDADILGVNDKQSHTTLLYGNGPGYSSKNYSSNDDIKNAKYRQHSAAYHSSSAHAGEDVPVYATGPGAFMFSGIFDQTYIPHAISFATCTGYHESLCSSANKLNASIALFVILLRICCKLINC